MVVLFLLQLGGIFASMELRAVINRGEFTGVDVLADLEDYKANPDTRSKWDKIHREFNCCGGLTFNDGYKVGVIFDHRSVDKAYKANYCKYYETSAFDTCLRLVFQIWRNADIGSQTNSVPDSCCLRVTEGCGQHIFREQDITMHRIIHTHGCITVMEPKLRDQVRMQEKGSCYFGRGRG